MICKGPCKKDLALSEFGEFYQKGRMFKQSRCKLCRRNIPADKGATQEMYRRIYPKDTYWKDRSWRLMAERLQGKGFSFNKKALEKYYGTKRESKFSTCASSEFVAGVRPEHAAFWLLPPTTSSNGT